MNNEFLTRNGLKMIDIGYLTIVYVTVSFLFSFFLDKWISKFDKEEDKKKSTIRLIFEMYFYFIVISIAAFLLRNAIKKLPLPHGEIGNEHIKRVSEINGGVIFAFAIFFFQQNLKDKINHLFSERLFANELLILLDKKKSENILT